MTSVLADILSSRVRAEIFRLLFGLDACELHLREIERRSGLSVATVRQELHRLSDMGLVIARRDGNRLYFSANRAHPLYPEIHSLSLKTTGLADVLRDALGREGIDAAFVFGSIATGAADAESDIDLMVIGRVGLRALAKRLSGVSARLGREINPYTLTPAEFGRRLKARDHFITSVLATPKVFIVGDEDELAELG